MNFLNPSSAARRVACPGSFKLENHVTTELDPQTALDGKLAHEIAAELLREVKAGNAGEITEKYRLLYNDDMLNGAAQYVGEIMKFLEYSRYLIEKLKIEEPLEISAIHPNARGVPDAWTYSGGDIYIFEYKYGRTYVPAFENWQLIEYAAGILNNLGIDSDHRIYFVIIQPRCYSYRGSNVWAPTIGELRPYFEKLKKAEHEATSDTPSYRVSKECLYCPARSICSTLQNAASLYFESANQFVHQDLSDNQIGNELRILKNAETLLKARITGLEADVEIRLKRGKKIPFFKLQEGYGREQWKAPIPEIIALGELFGVNLKKPTEIITPKQAEKAGLVPEVIAPFVEKLPGALRLEQENNILSRQIFNRNN